jgi:cytochrome c oxidase assembly factor CtaG
MHTLAVISSAWRWNVPGLLCCALVLALYVAFAGIRPSRALAWFIGGEAFLAMLVCSPLDVLARQYLFTAEAAQQMLIVLVAAYLLVVGTPGKAVRRLRLHRLRISYGVAWTIGMAAISVWYLPHLLNAALASDSVRFLEYCTLLAGGAVFWWPLHAPLRQHRVPLVPHAVLYLAAATVWCSLIGIFIAFGQSWSRAHYLNTPDTLRIAESLVSDWSFTRETDQETAGLVFWIGAATVLLTEVMFVYYRWYVSPEVRNESTLRASHHSTVNPHDRAFDAAD